MLETKFRSNLARRFSPKQQGAILAVTNSQSALEQEGAHLVDNGSSAHYLLLAHTMQGLQSELSFNIDWDESA